MRYAWEEDGHGWRDVKGCGLQEELTLGSDGEELDGMNGKGQKEQERPATDAVTTLPCCDGLLLLWLGHCRLVLSHSSPVKATLLCGRTPQSMHDVPPWYMHMSAGCRNWFVHGTCCDHAGPKPRASANASLAAHTPTLDRRRLAEEGFERHSAYAPAAGAALPVYLLGGVNPSCCSLTAGLLACALPQCMERCAALLNHPGCLEAASLHTSFYTKTRKMGTYLLPKRDSRHTCSVSAKPTTLYTNQGTDQNRGLSKELANGRSV